MSADETLSQAEKLEVVAKLGELLDRHAGRPELAAMWADLTALRTLVERRVHSPQPSDEDLFLGARDTVATLEKL